MSGPLIELVKAMPAMTPPGNIYASDTGLLLCGHSLHTQVKPR